jgi:hypothetical protein
MPFKKGVLARGPFPVTYLQEVAAASMLTTNGLFSNPTANGEMYEVLGVDWSYDVLSTSGTFDIRNVPAATAFTGGTTLLTAVQSLSATARTARKAPLATNRVTRQIQLGATISLIFAGTLTSLVGLSITLWLQAMRGIRGR